MKWQRIYEGERSIEEFPGSTGKEGRKTGKGSLKFTGKRTPETIFSKEVKKPQRYRLGYGG